MCVFATTATADGAKHAAMILDANTGEVLHDEDGDALRHPASLTKMMTLYLTFEAVETGRLLMSTPIQISDFAAGAAPSKLDLDPGSTITTGDAIKALITKSANDVAIALAEAIGGSEGGFVKIMNERARDLGMSKTHFENASGLPDPDQVTTARDMITLGLHLQDDYPAYYPMFASRSFTYAGKAMRNHNTLLNSFQGADGIKTGYTRMSGFNLVSSVRRGGRHVVGAVFGGASAATRNGEMRVLLSKALAQASRLKTRAPAPLLLAKLKAPPKIAVRIGLKSTIKPEEKPTLVDAAPSQLAARPEPKPFAPPSAAAPARQPLIEIEVAQAAPVEVYKVKRVMVTPRQKPIAPINPDQTTDMTIDDLIAAAATEHGQAAPTGLTTASLDAAGQETVIGKRASAPVEGEAISMLGARDVAPPVPELPPEQAPQNPVAFVSTATAAEAPSDEPAMLRGLAPSTLANQASALRKDKPRVAVAAKAKAGRYEIQIGAYDSADEAKKALASVKARAATLLKAETETQPVQKSGKTMYRARFAGFDASAANAACGDLKRQSIDCLVMTAE